MTAYLWLAAVVAGVASVVAWRRRWNRLVVAGGGGLAGVLALVAWLVMPKADVEAGARPDDWLVDSAVALNRAAMTPVSRESGSAAVTGGSLPELAERLAARLAQAPDDAGGWALLAVTYRHLGREQEAEAAQRRAVEAGGDPAKLGDMHRMTMRAAGLPPMLSGAGAGPAAQFVREGQRLRVQRRFAEAAQAFRQAVELDPSDADSWADLADSAAAAAGKDLAAGREALQQALAINPSHRKALWLKASLQLQERQYADAAATWRKLATLVQAGSPDARVIAANIAEAEALVSAAGRDG